MKQSPRSDKPLWIAVFCTILAFLVFLYTGRAPEQLDGREHSSPATAPDAAQPGSEPPQSKEAAPQPASPSATKPTSQSAQLPAAQAPEVLALRNWLQEFTQLSPDQRETALPEGIALARERRPVMRELIRSNPEAALQQAMRFDEWEALPTAIKAEVERPFSETIKYSLFPTCPGPGSAPNVSPNAQKPLIQVQLGNGEVVNGFIYGGRAAINSKEGLPAQGIALDGMAALWDGVFLALSAEEAAIVETKFPAGQPDPKRSFVTGESVTGEAVTALAGGKRFTFANTEELLKFDAAIAKLDAKPGPYAGSRAIFSLPYSTAAASGNVTALPFNMAAAEMQAADLAADWTTTAKKVFLIRVVLSGTSNTSLASKSEAETVLSGTVSPSIYKFSYGKTSVNATVSAGTYLLDSSASYYSGTMPSDTTAAGTFTSNSDTLLADAKAKFRSLQLTKGDGGINIGTVDGGVSSGSYDIVGVIFTDIGMYKGGAKYAGLASIGGRDLWIQGNNSPVVYVHEMGHLYGLDHANFWLTTDASVVGTGVEKEYGDPFDVMGSGTLPNGHFHPQAKQRLSWLTSGQYADAPASGSNLYRIYQHDSELTTGSLRGVRITKGTRTSGASPESEYYWIGYRPANTDNAHLTRGAYLLWEKYLSDNPNEKSMLLDTTPLTSGSSAAGKADSGLDIGRTYSDATAGIHITPVGYGGSSDGKYLDVQVHTGTLSSGSCTALVGGSSSIYARTDTAFTATASSSTGATLAYFWDAGDGTITGGSGANAAVFSHSYTTSGTYTVSLTVSDMKGATASGSLVVNVTDPAQQFTQRNNGTSGDINAVAASDTLIVAVGAATTSAGSRIRTSPDGETWTERPVPDTTTNLRLESVVWDGTRFVAVGQDYSSTLGWFGVIYTSTNGITWSRTYNSSTGDSALNAVSAGNGTILAVGDSGTVLQSSDGSNWAPITGIPSVTSGSMSCRGIAFGGGIFVLTARAQANTTGSGAVFTSTDNGASWREQTTGAGFASDSEDFEKIAYLNGKFITSGYFSKLKTGTLDNGTLTFSSSQTGYEQANVLGYASGLYFGSGFTISQTNGANTYTPVNLYSTDGGTWSAATPKIGMEYQNDGVFFNNRLVSVGSQGAIFQSGTLATNNNTPVISSLMAQTARGARIPITLAVTATDADGDALSYRWDAGDGIHSGTSSVFTNAYATGGTYNVSVTVNDGRGGSVTSGTALVVSDPFTLRTTGTTETLNGIANNGTIAVAVGNKGKVLTSADGITWSSRSVESFSGNMYLDQVIWDGFQFIAVGIDNQAGTSSGWKRIIYTSPNGINWTNRYPSSSSTQQYHFRSAASSGGTILVGGDNGLLVRSIDSGTSWSTIGAGTISSSHTISGLAYGEGTFAVTTHPQSGSILSGDGRVYTTADGTVLTNVSSGAALGTGFYLDTVAYLNDRFISSGLAATLRASTNKAATFAISTATTEQAHALAYGNGVYIAAGVDSGNNMVHALSTDGANWTQTSAPNGVVSEKAAAFFNNSFLIVGGGGQIWQSGSVATGIQPLELLKSPANLSVYEGASATLSVVAAGGGTLSYQWKKNGVALGSGTGSTYTIASAQTTDSGSYSVQVSDSASLTTLQSGSALLSVTGTTLTIANLIAAQPSPNVSMIQGSDATLGITLYSTGTYATDYTLYYGATPLAITGTIPASGTASAVAYIPLKSLTTGGSYSVKFSRYLSATERGSATSSAFNVSFLSWADYAAGTYQTLLANDASALSALNDGSVYRGFLSLSVSKFGSVSGKLYYNEATLLSGGTSGERLYAPIVRAFSGKFAPKAGNPSTMTFTPVRLGTAAQSTRESLTIDLDLSASPAKMSASLTDSVSLASGSCLSSASDVTKVASGLSTVDLAGLVGKYLLSANLANSAGVYEQQAYVQAQVLSTGRLLWTSRLRGHTGSGATYLNTNDATAPFAGLYEGSQITSSKLHNAYSLMGEVAFRLTGGSWAASIGSPELQDKLEKQASYVARQTTGSGSLAAVYNPAYFSSGTNSTGVKFISFSNNDVARWCGATFTGIPAYLPTARPLTLSVQDPLNSGTAALSWAVTIGSSGAVAAVPQTVNGVTSPNVVLQFTKTTGLWSGVYVLSGARRTLVGASLDQGTAAATRAAQGWAESGIFPATKTGTWTLSK